MVCKMILVSFSRNDFKQCGCQNGAYVDGGHDYLRVGAKDLSRVKVLKFVSAGRVRK